MTKGKDIDMMSNSEIKLLMRDLENEFYSIQHNIKKEADRMLELDTEYNKLKTELAKRGNFLSRKSKTIFVMEEDALNANTSI